MFPILSQFPSFLPDLLLFLVKTTTDIPENIGTTDTCVKFSHQFLNPFEIIAQSMVPSNFNMTGITAGTHWKHFIHVHEQSMCMPVVNAVCAVSHFPFSH